VGILSHGYPPSRIPIQGIPPLVIHPHVLLTRSKSMTTKKVRKKIRKKTRPCRAPAATYPAERSAEGTIIELTMLDFRPGERRALPAVSAPSG